MSNVFILLAGLLLSLIGAVFNSSGLIVAGVVVVCIPFLVRSIDAILAGKRQDAVLLSLLVAVYVLICILFLSTGNGEAVPFYNRPAIWVVAFGAGFLQLLWKLLIRPGN
jgi:hypothetical protein